MLSFDPSSKTKSSIPPLIDERYSKISLMTSVGSYGAAPVKQLKVRITTETDGPDMSFSFHYDRGRARMSPVTAYFLIRSISPTILRKLLCNFQSLISEETTNAISGGSCLPAVLLVRGT